MGLLKALGARASHILVLFLMESALLALIGGCLGVAASLSLLEVADRLLPAFPLAAPMWAVPLALTVCWVVGLLSGVLPAMRATRLDPVEALTGRTR